MGSPSITKNTIRISNHQQVPFCFLTTKKVLLTQTHGVICLYIYLYISIGIFQGNILTGKLYKTVRAKNKQKEGIAFHTI